MPLGDDRLAGRVQHQLLHLGANPPEAQTGRVQQPRDRLGLDVELVLLQALPNPAAAASCGVSSEPQSTSVACLRSTFTRRRLASSGPATNTSVVIGSGVLDVGLELFGRRDAGRAFRLPPGGAPVAASRGLVLPSHAWVRAGAPPRGSRRPAAAPSSAGSAPRPGSWSIICVPGAGGRRFVGVEALDVEGLEALVHEAGELQREIVARLQVVAFQEVERTGLPAATWARTSAGFIEYLTPQFTCVECAISPNSRELCRWRADLRAVGMTTRVSRGVRRPRGWH